MAWSHRRSWIARGGGLLLALALVAAACGPQPMEEAEEEAVTPEEEEEVALTWATISDEGHRQVAERWNEQNPDQQVQMVVLPPTADAQFQQLVSDHETGTGAFDVMSLDVIWTGELAEAGYLASLEDLREPVEDVAIPSALETAQWDGELWTVPYSTNFGMLYYRTDLVDEPPRTWDELFDAATEIAQEHEDVDGLAAQGDSYEGFVVNFLELFWGAGGEVLTEDGTASAFAEGDAAETALAWMSDAVEEGVYVPGVTSMIEDDALGTFKAGEAAFMRNWPYALPILLEDEESEVRDVVDIAPLPTFDGEGTMSALGGINLAVSSLSDDPETAQEFVAWAATDREAQELLAEFQPPPTMEALYEEYEDVVPEDLQEIYAVLNETRQDARARPPLPRYTSFSAAVQDELHPVFAGTADPQEAIEAVDEAIERALEVDEG